MIYKTKSTKNVVEVGEEPTTFPPVRISQEDFDDVKKIVRIVRRTAYQVNPCLDKNYINPMYVGKIEIIKYVRESYYYSLREANDIVSAAQEIVDEEIKSLRKEING
jgi:hypothetical protein